MPELPEVEITRRGVAPGLVGRTVSDVVVRSDALRYPVPDDLGERLAGARLAAVRRRGKYLLFDFDRGTLLLHLGMSGSLRLVATGAPPGKHDHLDLVFGADTLRLRDPRRFGAALWAGTDAATHPLVAPLGVEPLSAEFSAESLHALTRGRRTPIKLVLMDSHLIVGIGNIYASESLFRAGIRPTTPAGRLSRGRCARLVEAIRTTLASAIAAGGSTLRDFVHADGVRGGFQTEYFVYGREGEPCRICGSPIRSQRLGQRSTFHCPRCQS